jgi:hypothetical protein
MVPNDTRRLPPQHLLVATSWYLGCVKSIVPWFCKNIILNSLSNRVRRATTTTTSNDVQVVQCSKWDNACRWSMKVFGWVLLGRVWISRAVPVKLVQMIHAIQNWSKALYVKMQRIHDNNLHVGIGANMAHVVTKASWCVGRNLHFLGTTHICIRASENGATTIFLCFLLPEGKGSFISGIKLSLKSLTTITTQI